jgi:hypothetical protein
MDERVMQVVREGSMSVAQPGSAAAAAPPSAATNALAAVRPSLLPWFMVSWESA